jgi:hypothetical protein
MHDKSSNAVRGLAAAAALATIALTGAAFWLSYEHLHDVAATYGLSGARAWAWPATVDLFIVAGELLILRASLRGQVDPWAITLAATGSLGSIALNVAGVGTGASPMEYVVAAVPPSAALIAFGALMRQVHERLATRLATAPEQPVFLPVLQPATSAEESVAASATALEVAIEEALRPVAEDAETVALMTTAEVAKVKGVAEGTVRSWVSRNKLKPVQRDGDSRLLFHPTAVAALD